MKITWRNYVFCVKDLEDLLESKPSDLEDLLESKPSDLEDLLESKPSDLDYLASVGRSETETHQFSLIMNDCGGFRCRSTHPTQLTMTRVIKHEILCFSTYIP
jgi:hypothetical protein